MVKLYSATPPSSSEGDDENPDAVDAATYKLHYYRNDGKAKDLAKTANLVKTPKVGIFNDQIRDAIKESRNGSHAGWVQLPSDSLNDEIVNKIKYGFMAKIIGGRTNPSQTVNYVSVHDNYAFYDKVTVSGRKYSSSVDRVKRQALQADTMALLSQGISFIHAGSEMLRSKPLGKDSNDTQLYDHNSYQSPDSVDSIKWDEKYDNMTTYNAYRQIIALKLHAPAFNYATRSVVDAKSTLENPGNSRTLFKFTYQGGEDQYTIYHYGVGNNRDITDLSGQEVLLDTSGTLKSGNVIMAIFA